MAHRYYCHQCERKFSIRVVGNEGGMTKFPQEIVLLLDHVGRLVSRLNELIMQLEEELTKLGTQNTSGKSNEFEK